MKEYIMVAALTAAAIPASANATTVLETQAQTSAGQLFSYSFAGLGTPTGPGSITITARGDYSFGFPQIESLDYDIEGLLTGNLSLESADTTTAFSFDDNQFSSTFALTLADFQTLTADGVIDITLDLSDGVNLFNPDTAFTSVGITLESVGAVPEPASWAMMIGGFGLVGGAMRRRRKANVKVAFA